MHLRRGFCLFLITVSCLFVGCRTAPTPAPSITRESLLFDYQRQHYEQCISGIQKLLANQPSRRIRGELMLLESICAEEMNQPARAADLYRQLIATQHGSTVASRAAKRLAGTESDQREHFSIRSIPGNWARVDKQWNGSNLRERYVSKADSRETIVILARDLYFERLSIAQAVSQVQAVLEMDAQRVNLNPVRENENEALFEFAVSNSNGGSREPINGEVQFGTKLRRGTGVGRLLLTKDRMHVILYSTAANLSDSQKNAWLENIAQAQLISLPALAAAPSASPTFQPTK